MKLQFGFEDFPYSGVFTPQSPLTVTQKKRMAKTLSKPQQRYGGGRTVGQVAERLENKYGILEVFYGMEEDFIADNFEDAMANALGIGMMGGSFDYDWDATPLQQKFRTAISTRKFDGVIKGVPTKAAQRGISHLRRVPGKAGAAPRPSFMNTGLYMRSFRAWTEK